MASKIDKNFPVASQINNPLTSDITLEPKIITSEDESFLKYSFKDEKTLHNLKFIIKDILSGDNSVAKREEYAYLNFKQIQAALNWLLQNDFDDDLKTLLLTDPWRLTFKNKPPTPEEFLSSKYIGATADFIWKPVRKTFTEFLDPLKPYRAAILNPSIGSGKSFLVILILLYISCHFALMRDPRKFFNFPSTSVFCIALCAVTISKASEIYTEPVQQLLESAEFWYQCRTRQEMLQEDKKLQENDEVEYIAWTTSAKTSVISTSGNLNWKQISSANSLLGMQILVGVMTEITFFLESGKGWTNDRILTFSSRLRQRIKNRFANNYYARFALDSSPSTLEDSVQQYMTYEAPKNPENYIWKGSRWNIYPWEFPNNIEYDEKEDKIISETYNYDNAFKLFTGGNGSPPKVITNEEEEIPLKDENLIWCPKMHYKAQGMENYLIDAQNDTLEFMKNIAGIPAGQADRLFYQGEWIENCFNNGLRNVYGSIVALANEEPEHLIWNQICSTFFYKILDKWYYYYDPGIPRVISVDQSKSKDCTCIAMSHLERDANRIDEHTGQAVVVYVTDFTIVLVPKGGLINLDAIKFFIWDLRRIGGLNIRHVSFDGYQSEPTKQFLKRLNFTVDYVSVDANNDPYFTFYDLVIHNRWACGKNIFVKNNMKSLYQARRKNTGSMKIEHFPGDLNYAWEMGDWTSCGAGYHAKDCTDAIAGNIQLLGVYSQEFIPYKVWNPQEVYEMDYDSIQKKNLNYVNTNKMMIL
jgi:hypothetical protein